MKTTFELTILTVSDCENHGIEELWRKLITKKNMLKAPVLEASGIIISVYTSTTAALKYLYLLCVQ